MTCEFFETDTDRLFEWYVDSRADLRARAFDLDSLRARIGVEFEAWRATLPTDVRALSRADIGFLRNADLPGDFPRYVLARGNPGVLARPTVAIIGSRTPSLYGRRMAHDFARELALAGVTVISGGALGIDGIANRAALTHGHSCAVVGGGLLRPHPRSHIPLFHDLVRSGQGLVLSQFPEGDHAQPWHFPRRNLTLALLADFVLVVEASFRSGSLITAREALDRNVDLGALPGALESPLSSGTNTLIASGAFCIQTPRDILERLVTLKRMREERVRLFEEVSQNFTPSPTTGNKSLDSNL